MKRKIGYLTGAILGASLLIAAGVEIFSVNEQKINAASYTQKASEIRLSEYHQEVVFEDSQDVKKIAKQYNIPHSEDIEEIVYVPIEDPTVDDGMLPQENSDSGISRMDIGLEEYYVKKKGSTEKMGESFRSSWYQHPDGSMSVNETGKTAYSFQPGSRGTVGESTLETALKAAYGFSVTKSVSITDTQNVEVKKGCKRNIKAYVNNLVYNYELWEDDVWYDDYKGSGKVTKPVGVVYLISHQL
ncbi:MAG: hypothetical protein K6G65_03005 [Lachnospiraceae bacterium]|nr:hypothetical protein [Lachnospiraceae bacterium]